MKSIRLKLSTIKNSQNFRKKLCSDFVFKFCKTFFLNKKEVQERFLTKIKTRFKYSL